MTNGECIYRKTVDYMSRMTLEKDDSRTFSVIWEFRVTGNWVAARVASRLEMGLVMPMTSVIALCLLHVNYLVSTTFF